MMLRLALLGADEALRASLAPHLPDVTLVAAPAPGDLVVNPDRYLPSRQLIHREIAAGKLGEPGLVRIHRWESRPARSAATGELPGPLVRDLDLALWLIGQPVCVVFAAESAAKAPTAAAGRLIQVHLGFIGNRMALIDYCDRLPPGEGYASLSVIGSAGAAYADDHQNMQLAFRGGRPQAVRTGEGTGYLRRIVQELGRDPAGIDGRAVDAVAAAVWQSLQSRQAVSLEGRR